MYFRGPAQCAVSSSVRFPLPQQPVSWTDVRFLAPPLVVQSLARVFQSFCYSINCFLVRIVLVHASSVPRHIVHHLVIITFACVFDLLSRPIALQVMFTMEV